VEKNLDRQQMAAVETESRRAMVIAGAGSGKTRVLIERIAHLIEKQQVSPYEVMGFSFTRKASNEIRERLVARVGNKAYKCHLGTMHSLALGFIQQFGEVIGVRPKSVTVYGEFETNYLFKDVGEELGVKKVNLGKARKALEEYYNSGEEPEEDTPERDVFVAFMDRCRENNSVTYGGLLVGMRILIPTIAKFLTIKHVLVDEVQDISSVQWKIIREMVDAFGASLYVVGDEDQVLYSWRGVDPSYLYINQDAFDIYKLETNYRSRRDIVLAANRLIRRNKTRIGKTMVPVRPEEAPGMSSVESWDDCDSAMVARVLSVPEGIGNMAVLCRKHSLLVKLSSLMKAAGIKHTYVGRVTELTRSEYFVKFHAFLKLIVNEFDNFSFLLIRELLGVSRGEFLEIRFASVAEMKSHFQVWSESHTSGFFEGRADWREWSLGDTVANLLSLFSPIGLQSGEYIKEHALFTPAAEFAMAWSKENPSSTIMEYLSWVSTFDLQDEVKDEEKEGVILSTVHAAKGLEWDQVIVIGLNEGIMPAHPDDPGQIEEERRIAFVAMTRAREQLILAVRPTKKEVAPGVFKQSPKSRFVQEAITVGGCETCALYHMACFGNDLEDHYHEPECLAESMTEEELDEIEIPEERCVHYLPKALPDSLTALPELVFRNADMADIFKMTDRIIEKHHPGGEWRAEDFPF
jgi:DNA helicase-2/ATP-dependent DNA helicase PcrA